MKGARKMEIQSIRNLLVESGYNKSNFTIGKKVIDIPDMYIKQNKEAYIILEYLIFKEKFEEYQRKILWFQNCSDNEIIKYNINIIIVYNSSEIKDVDDFITDIKKYECDLHICRKIFIDLENEENINLLPFLRIQAKGKAEEEISLISEIKSVINNEEVISELLKEEPNFKSIDSLL